MGRGWGGLAPTLTFRAAAAASLLPFHLSNLTRISLLASLNLKPHREGIPRNVVSS